MQLPGVKKYPRRPKGYIDAAEVSRLLDITRQTLWRYRTEAGSDFPEGQLVDGKLWFPEAAVRRWAAERGRPVDKPWITERV